MKFITDSIKTTSKMDSRQYTSNNVTFHFIENSRTSKHDIEHCLTHVVIGGKPYRYRVLMNGKNITVFEHAISTSSMLSNMC